MKNNEDKKTLALAAANFLISNQLTLLRLTSTEGDITLAIPTVEGITRENLIQILCDNFSEDLYTFKFEFIKPAKANGITIIHIVKNK